MRHTQRFGVGDISFELETDWESLHEFWRFYTTYFQTDESPVVRYVARGGEKPFLESLGCWSRPLEREIDLFPLLTDAFLTDLLRIFGQRCPIHHAAVLVKDGRADLFLGEPNAGKSTLCVRRVQQGERYLSDEMAALDGDEVIALPRPISFNELENSSHLLPRDDPRFTAIGYDFVDKAGAMRWAEFYHPKPDLAALAGQRFPLGSVTLLERVEGAAPRHRLLDGPEKRAHLALSRFPIEKL